MDAKQKLQIVALVHFALSLLLEKDWDCRCSACKGAREAGVNLEVTNRVRLVALRHYLDHEQVRVAWNYVGFMTDEQVGQMIPRKMERLKVDCEDRRRNRQLQEEEPV